MRLLWMAVRERAARLLVRLGLYQPEKVMYIGGSDTLPSPLTREGGGELIARLGQGDPEARARLIEHNLRLVVYIARRFENTGINIKDLPLRLGVFGAEPWTEEMRREIEDKLGITATNIYGLSEIMGPGVSQSCAKEQHGMHIWEDHFLPEIIDPVSGEILPEGSTGELVITTLTKQGIPLVRYRTRDITSLNYTPCSCGRTHVRMNRITGRSDDMLIIRGVNVFPSQIESLLLEVQGVSPHYQLILTRENNLDYVEVQVELDGAMFSDAIKDLQQREQRIQKGIKEFLGVTTKVRLVEPPSIPRSEGKAVRVIDRRVMQ